MNRQISFEYDYGLEPSDTLVLRVIGKFDCYVFRMGEIQEVPVC